MSQAAILTLYNFSSIINQTSNLNVSDLSTNVQFRLLIKTYSLYRLYTLLHIQNHLQRHLFFDTTYKYVWCYCDRASLILQYKQTTRCNNNNLLVISNFKWQGHQQATSSVHYTTSCKHSLVLLRMGEIIARNMLSWLKLLINCFCCIQLVVYAIV